MKWYVVYKLTFIRKGVVCTYIGVTQVPPGTTAFAALMRRRHWHIHPPPGCKKTEWLTAPYDVGTLKAQTLTDVLPAATAWDVELWKTAEAMLQDGGMDTVRGGWGGLLPTVGICRRIVARPWLRLRSGSGGSPQCAR